DGSDVVGGAGSVNRLEEASASADEVSGAAGSSGSVNQPEVVSASAWGAPAASIAFRVSSISSSSSANFASAGPGGSGWSNAPSKEVSADSSAWSCRGTDAVPS